MGCDIHIFAEVKEGTTWKKVGNVFKGYGDSKTSSPYSGRDYDLFALLAGVRNRNELTPIKKPTYSLPDDCCNEIKSDYEMWGCDAHSLTYYTLSELLFFDWGFTFEQSGVINPEQQQDLLNGIIPNSWCQGTNQIGFERREWQEKFESSFVTQTIPALQKLGDSDNVRVIMWFDN